MMFVQLHFGDSGAPNQLEIDHRMLHTRCLMKFPRRVLLFFVAESFLTRLVWSPVFLVGIQRWVLWFPHRDNSFYLRSWLKWQPKWSYLSHMLFSLFPRWTFLGVPLLNTFYILMLRYHVPERCRSTCLFPLLWLWWRRKAWRSSLFKLKIEVSMLSWTLVESKKKLVLWNVEASSQYFEFTEKKNPKTENWRPKVENWKTKPNWNFGSVRIWFGLVFQKNRIELNHWHP